MTLTEALAALVAAGKLRSAWLPGMRVRSIRLTERGDSVPWVRAVHGLTVLSWHVEGVWGSHAAMGPVLDEPDLDDPATAGCLLALLREASGDPYITTGYIDDDDDSIGGVRRGWVAFIVNENGDPAWALDIAPTPTEGEALAAALVALAEVARHLGRRP